MSVKNLTIGEKIRILRIRANLNQGELAAKVGVHLNTVHRWENNEGTKEIRLSRLRKLAKVLKTSVEDLIDNEAA